MVSEKLNGQESQPETAWWAVCFHYARKYWFYAGFLFLSSVFVLILFFHSLFQMVTNGISLAVQYALVGGLAGFIGTALGTVPALVLNRLPSYVEDTMLGFAAGMMMAASAFSLILPGLSAGTAMTGSRVWCAGIVVLGMALGVILMLSLHKFTPHAHEKIGFTGPGNERFNKI